MDHRDYAVVSLGSGWPGRPAPPLSMYAAGRPATRPLFDPSGLA